MVHPKRAGFIPLESPVAQKGFFASRQGFLAGFTLVEILILLAIMALLAAISIPNYLSVRHDQNQASAIASMKSIARAQESYCAANKKYTVSLKVLSESNPPYLDTALAAGVKQGYVFNIEKAGKDTFYATAVPKMYQITGTSSFSVDETKTIRSKDNGGAPLIEGQGNPAD